MRRGGRWVALVGVLVAAAAIPAVPATAATTYTVLQMNLCDSGMAHSCYTFGRSVDEAVQRIRAYAPDLVTFQEICREDLYGKLARAMADLYGADRISVDFQPARNRYTGRAYRCLNGQPFGIGLVLRGTRHARRDGWYTAQDGDDEIRTWVCVTTAKSLTVCTTHLSTVTATARRQCAELVAGLPRDAEVIVAGDLNLTRDCAPYPYEDHGDGALQHVLATVPWIDGGTQPMRYTDHPLLYARYRLP
jgi:endonuclease/exonuclease/phosphatase family metal-dependent hydrolase